MSNNKFENSWLKNKVQGFQRYSAIPTSVLLHPGISNADLRVYACLAAHADKTGRAYVSRARIAQMCGYMQKGEPNVQFISRFLSKTGSLVKAGFVKNLGQKGFDECCVYQLVVPNFDAMPESTLRRVDSLHSETYKEYKRTASDVREASKIYEHTGDGSDMIEHDGELIFRSAVIEDAAQFDPEFGLVYSAAVYAKFSIPRPSANQVQVQKQHQGHEVEGYEDVDFEAEMV